jgi:hypothetical protein
VGQVNSLRPYHHITEYAGLTDQVAQLADSFPEDAVLLFEQSDGSIRISAPLWLVFNKTTFLLQENALSDPALLPAVELWEREGRPVYWLGSNQRPTPIAAGLHLQFEAIKTFSAPLAETPTKKLPEHIQQMAGTFDVYQVSTTPFSTFSTVTTIFAAGTQGGPPEVTGLFEATHLPGLSPRQWTSGQVTVQLPANEHLSEIILRMGNGRPPGIPLPNVTAYLDDIALETVEVKGSDDVYNLVIPSGWQPSGDTAVLRLEMAPWVPAETGYNTDQRELGVYLDWIKLITTEVKE